MVVARRCRETPYGFVLILSCVPTAHGTSFLWHQSMLVVATRFWVELFLGRRRYECGRLSGTVVFGACCCEKLWGCPLPGRYLNGRSLMDPLSTGLSPTLS